MFALIAAVAVGLQDAPAERRAFPVEQTHDQVRGESKSALSLGVVHTDPDPWKFKANMSFVSTWSGVDRAPLKPEGRIKVVIVVRSRDGGFEADDRPDLAILTAGGRIHDTDTDRIMDFVDEEVSRPGFIPRRRGQPPERITEISIEHLCKETLTWDVSFGDLLRVFGAKVNSAEMSVGKRKWRLESDQCAAIKNWVARLAVSDAELQKAEAAAAKAESDADAATAARLAPARADVEKVVEKAEKAKRSVPKKQYATTGERLKWRTFDREIQEVVKRHKLRPDDLQFLLKDHPEFQGRPTID